MHQAIIFLIPVFNDWQALDALIPEILRQHGVSQYQRVHFVVVDDHSDEEGSLAPAKNLQSKTAFTFIRLARNMGHQVAITIGLHYIQEHLNFRHLIVLDADGQDNPADIDNLTARAAQHPDCVIAARRISRVKSSGFTALYYLHRILTRLLTGKTIAFGNYLLLTPANLKLLVNSRSTWVSFSGTVAKLAPCIAYVNSTRLEREKGSSKMPFSKLFMHSLRINSVFARVLSLRILFLVVLCAGAAFLLPSIFPPALPTVCIILCLLLLLLLSGIKAWFENFSRVRYEMYILKLEGAE